MAGRPKRTDTGFAPLESDVMRVLFAAEAPVPVRHVLDELNRRREQQLAYTTVMTVMNRLTTKSALVRHGEPRRYLYEAAGENAAALAVREVIRTHGDAAVAHLVDEARADPDVMRRLRALLTEHER